MFETEQGQDLSEAKHFRASNRKTMCENQI